MFMFRFKNISAQQFIFENYFLGFFSFLCPLKVVQIPVTYDFPGLVTWRLSKFLDAAEAAAVVQKTSSLKKVKLVL